MLSNYNYFIALAEERSISRAAERLYISHQCLSKYLKNLEKKYHVSLFDRSPSLTLTPAGEVYLSTIRQVQLLEANMESQFEDILQAKRGLLRFGTTEGRYRILVPDMLSSFNRSYPNVRLDVQCGPSSKHLKELVMGNKLDLVLLNEKDIDYHYLDSRPILEEQMYLVISDTMLEKYFPDRYPACKEEFAQGVDLRQFQEVPFVLAKQGFNSRGLLEKHLNSLSVKINCVMEMTQLDLHFMMSARDYAASFCWSMYAPSIRQMNETQRFGHLNIFPLKGQKIRNQVVLVTRKGKIFPAYGRALISQIEQQCRTFADDSPPLT